MIEKMKDNFRFGYTIKCDDSVKAQILEANRKFTVIWSVAQILFWGYCLLMSTRKPDYMECRNIYAFAVSVCAVTLLLALFVSPKVPKLTHLTAIAVDEAFLLAGMAVAMHLAPRTILIFASVLCVQVFFIYIKKGAETSVSLQHFSLCKMISSCAHQPLTLYTLISFFPFILSLLPTELVRG